nr:MAG TPA: hypothetical protein [Caudoviricetes sp.]
MEGQTTFTHAEPPACSLMAARPPFERLALGQFCVFSFTFGDC